mmetsp:Transcript_45598/g.90427  ORF Transcript_45598/g.90427 Transcript_45598/m.90427 type:complete len:546 (-) Transcript_45598:129-1766(-)
MELRVLLPLLVAGWCALYLWVLLGGQTVPQQARLRESWLFPGRLKAEPVDMGELPDWNIWVSWKTHVPIACALFGAYLVLGRVVCPQLGPDGMRTLAGQRYMLAWGVFFVTICVGVGGFSVLAMVSAANYGLAYTLCRGLRPSGSKPGRTGWRTFAIWAFNIPMMSLVIWLVTEDEQGTGQRLLRFLPTFVSELPFGLGFQGLGPWQSYRFMCLRLISFACDSVLAAAAPPVDQRPALDTVSGISEWPRPEQEYFGRAGLLYYVSYLAYPPLFCVGPFLGYNGFVEQVQRPCRRNSQRVIAKYALGVLGYHVILEASTHVFFYSGWLGTGTPLMVLLDMPLAEMVVAIHVLLNFEWMSLLATWRFHRLVAMLDGIDTCENMARNINLICSFQEMWRHWHVSLNRFAVRYLYVPLGGSKRPLVGILATFIFVAFWHEVNGAGTALHWYVWGGLNCLCIMFEKMAVGRLRCRGPVAKALLGAATYQAMQWANIPAMMCWDTSCALAVRLTEAWRLVLPPVLYGLQGLAAAEAVRTAAAVKGSKLPAP